MKTVILIALVLTACAADRPSAPVVRFVLEASDTTDPAIYLDAASGWNPLGFDFTTEPTGLPSCNAHWFDEGQTDCEITIYLFRVPTLIESAGTAALSDRAARTINIDSSVTGFELSIATAHETGHIVLDTATHTAGGIMGGADDRMWPVDATLACQAIHICVSLN